jgi:DNA-binding SARP family transcriptional activator
MNSLRICLFGRFRVQCGQQDLTNLCPPRLQELVSYLLLHRDRSHPRETLASLLWSESSTAQSKKNLRQTLWQLQALTDSYGQFPYRRLLLVDSDQVCLNPNADVWLDVATYEQAYARAEGVAGQLLDTPRIEALRGAVELYRGDLLEGWFQDWCLFERERLQNLYLAILDKLMDYCEAHEHYEAGLAYGTRILRCDGARERTHRRLMRLYYLAGDRTAALRQYERCVQALRRELAVCPAVRTVALYEQIRTERLGKSPPSSAPGATPSGSASAQWGEMADSLKKLQQIMDELGEQLENAVQIAMQSMKRWP